jgi:hypothetical protein
MVFVDELVVACVGSAGAGLDTAESFVAASLLSLDGVHATIVVRAARKGIATDFMVPLWK